MNTIDSVKYSYLTVDSNPKRANRASPSYFWVLIGKKSHVTCLGLIKHLTQFRISDLPIGNELFIPDRIIGEPSFETHHTSVCKPAETQITGCSVETDSHSVPWKQKHY